MDTSSQRSLGRSVCEVFQALLPRFGETGVECERERCSISPLKPSNEARWNCSRSAAKGKNRARTPKRVSARYSRMNSGRELTLVASYSFLGILNRAAPLRKTLLHLARRAFVNRSESCSYSTERVEW